MKLEIIKNYVASCVRMCSNVLECVSAGEIQQLLNFKSRTSVQRILKKMLDAGKIKKTGDSKNVIYTKN